MMGGVNGAPDYIRTMDLGYLTPAANGGKVGATVTDSTKQGGIVAAYYLGTLIGCLVGGWIGDKLGRKKTIWIGALWILVGAPLQAAAQNVAWMVMARIITGVGTGHLKDIMPEHLLRRDDGTCLALATCVLRHPEFKILEDGTVPQRNTSKNLAAAYAPQAKLHLIEKPVPKPREGEVVVHVRATGICGSDCHFWKHGRIGDSMIVRDTCGAGHDCR
ncbi:hypothetical protein Rt10032_c21g6455 [Rhodotorula toruloides]|uniref:Uncharacterized protein n=1 Tax=Rhodotorula toruloides TaxID=5286 RepID=A0A511KPZ3_RHOTO|nr:hypothetical protein Rt10032_c21g6455 [Rhodotorula toruloides]